MSPPAWIPLAALISAWSLVLFFQHPVLARSSPSLLQSESLEKLSSQFMSSRQFTTSSRWSFENCGLPNYALTIENLEISPDPPKPGVNLTITARGTVNEVIEKGAYVDVVVKLGSYIKLLHKQFDICEELPKSNLTLRCPIQPGEYEVVQTVSLPREIPPAKYTVSIRAYTVDEQDMACANLAADFGR